MDRMGFVNRENMGLFTDLYELTMAASYFENDMDMEATFDLFFRKMPERNYLILAGVEQALKYLQNLEFGGEYLEYLRGKGFKDEFLDYLRDFRFEGDVFCMDEGTVVFPGEPLFRVTAPIIQAQLVETFLLNATNLQTTIASKASRVVNAARGRDVVEFGLRRTQGYGGVLVARAAYIGGCSGTSNVLAGKQFGIPVFGTMAHSFVMAFEEEKDSFSAFSDSFPDSTTLLIDTYDNIEGAKKAVEVAKEMEKKGHKLRGVRLDSGNIVEISKRVREILDENGLEEVKIFASGGFDEYKIERVLKEGAQVDAFGVGTRLSVSSDAPYSDVVYKLSEISKQGEKKPKMKFSTGKETLPGRKQVFRQTKNGKYRKDVIGLEGERLEGKKLLQKRVSKGKVVKELPSLKEIRERVKEEMGKLPEELKSIHQKSEYSIEESKKLKEKIRKFKEKHGEG